MRSMQNYLLFEPVPSPRPLPEDLALTPVQGNIEHKYTITLSLGSGASGSVMLGRQKDTKEQVAIKRINKKGMSKTQMKRLKREYGIMQKLNHPNWVKLHEVFEDDIEVCLVMEYASCGDLFTRITESPNARLSEIDAKPIFAQMAAGMLYLHQMGFVHRDIKPENVLLGKDGRVLVADLGFAAMWDEKTLTAAPCGSLYYASPEIIKHDGVYYGPEVDVWSLGATLYAMTCGKLPFAGDSNDEIRDLILEGDFSFPYFIGQQLRSLITGMLNTDPFKRLTMEAVVNHPWLKEEKTPRKVGNTRRHSAIQGLALSLRRSYKVIPLFSSEEEAEVYLEIERLKAEIKEHKKLQVKLERKAKKEEEAEKKRQKKKKKEEEQKQMKSARRKSVDTPPTLNTERDKGKEKTKKLSTKTKSNLHVIAEEGSPEGCSSSASSPVPQLSAAELKKQTKQKEERMKKWAATQAKRKKKRNSLAM